MERWSGKVAVVTGASSGIGAAVCEKFASEGLIVIGLARRIDMLQKLSAAIAAKRVPGKMVPIQADITQVDKLPEVFDKIKKEFGGVDVLVNNAGVLRCTHPIYDSSTQDFKDILDTNVLAMAVCCREAIRSMKDRSFKGHIFNVNSVTGHKIVQMPPGSYLNLYSASKYAVTALTQSLKNEMVSIQSSIKITSISPGLVKTEIFESGNLEMLHGDEIERFPHVKPEDIAENIAYVLSTPPHVMITEVTIGHVNDGF